MNIFMFCIHQVFLYMSPEVYSSLFNLIHMPSIYNYNINKIPFSNFLKFHSVWMQTLHYFWNHKRLNETNRWKYLYTNETHNSWSPKVLGFNFTSILVSVRFTQHCISFSKVYPVDNQDCNDLNALINYFIFTE